MINKNDPNLDLPATLSNRVYKRASNKGHQLDYEIIVDHLSETRLNKCREYGEDRYEKKGLEFNLWMCFGDVYRKYIRLETLTQLAVKGDESAIESLKDAYLDLANYGIMGYQILNNEENLK